MNTLLFFKNFPIEKDPVLYAIPFFILFILIEIYIQFKENKELYEYKDSWASISMGLGSVAINGIMKLLAFSFFCFLYQYRLFEIGWHFWSFILIFFADDFTFYWHHRLSHEIRILWAAHVNHHSSQKYNLSTALRQSWMELIYKYIWWCWMPLIGFDPMMILMMMSISLIYQFWIHTELIDKLPFGLEYFMNSPSHHRVHHAVNVEYLDRNHAGILIIWDKIFGTFASEKTDNKPIYGITQNINTFNPLKIATHEFKNMIEDIQKARSFQDKLKYIFYAPGWSHDGKSSTAKMLRKEKLQKAD